MHSSLQINCSPSKSINFQTPLNMFTSITPSHVHPFDYKRLKPFDCLAYAHDKHRQSKVDPVAKRYILVGIEDNARAWRLWDKQSRRIFVTGDAEFREDVFPAADKHHSPDITPFLSNNTNLDNILSSNTTSTHLSDNHDDGSLPDQQDLSSSSNSLLNHSLDTLNTHNPEPSPVLQFNTEAQPLDHLPEQPLTTTLPSEPNHTSPSVPSEPAIRRTT